MAWPLCKAVCITELLLGIFKKEPTPPLCSEKGATVFCNRAIQWFNTNCLICLIWKINQTKLLQKNDYYAGVIKFFSQPLVQDKWPVKIHLSWRIFYLSQNISVIADLSVSCKYHYFLLKNVIQISIWGDQGLKIFRLLFSFTTVHIT